MDPTTGPALPAPLIEFLHGDELADKVGTTLLLVAAGADGWPRLAMLSVGEVVAKNGTEIEIALYATSGTTEALSSSGKGLISLVLAGIAYRIRAVFEQLTPPSGSTLAYFRGTVASVDEDQVGYARIVDGIRYELVDQDAVVRRWKGQVSHLREVGRS